MTKNKREEFILPYQAHVDDHPECMQKDNSDVEKILDELRRVLMVTHEQHNDLKLLRTMMSKLDSEAYGSNLS